MWGQQAVAMGERDMADDRPAPVRATFTLAGPSRAFDPDKVAIRPDLADLAVAHSHFAPHYAEAMPMRLIQPAMLTATPAADGRVVAELPGDAPFALLDVTAGWAWGYGGVDRQVGYVPADALGRPAT